MQPQKNTIPRNRSSDEDHPEPAAQASENLNLRDQMDEHDYEQFLKFFRPKTEAERNIDFSQLASRPSPRGTTQRRLPRNLQISKGIPAIAIDLTSEEQDSDLAKILSQLPKIDSTSQLDAGAAAKVAAASTGIMKVGRETSVDEVRPMVQPPKELSRNQASRRGRRGRRAAKKTTPRKK